MNFLRLLLTSCMLFLLAGCFQVTTVVRVNPDGSGTVEENMLLSKKLVAQIEGIMGSFGGNGEKPKPFELFEPAKLKERASSMGQGVSYLSGKKVETSDYTGYTATYAFININTLKLSQQNGDPTGNSEPKDLPFTFSFSKGSPATLTIVQPQTKASEKTPSAPEQEPSFHADTKPQMSDENAKKFMELFMGIKLVLAVEMNGTIVSTNATHVDGNRLTIVDLDLAKLGNAGPELEKLSLLENSSFEEARELLKGIPGIRFDMNEKLTVVFKK
ncbi:MAG: hypothetical protein CXR31_12590 [Geobacter sp.]|nr:MAG: hypothetical protein CXR31_12590 [Geobacter sp.]